MEKKVVKMEKEVKNVVKFQEIDQSEMLELVKNLPDWASEERRRLESEFKGFRYAVNGIRVDGLGRMMKSDGEFQWMLYYLFYRVCGKGKKTEYCSKLAAAVCVDKKGRYGMWVSDELRGMEIRYLRKEEREISVEEFEILDSFKYIKLKDWEFNKIGLSSRKLKKSDSKQKLNFSITKIKTELKSFLKRIKYNLRYPQTEFIYKLENRELKNWI